jgi:hypothetical protein
MSQQSVPVTLPVASGHFRSISSFIIIIHLSASGDSDFYITFNFRSIAVTRMHMDAEESPRLLNRIMEISK